MASDVLHFGYTDSIHLLPLLHPLQAGWVYPTGVRLELVALPPAALADALAAGSVDGGLIDPRAYARLRAGVEVMPGIGLAAAGANSYAVLQSPARVDALDGQHVAVGPDAAGSVAETLLQVLASPYYSIDLTVDPPGAAPEAGTAPARLLAGDAAVAARAPWLRYEARFSPSALAAEERGARGGSAEAAAEAAPDPALVGYAEDLGGAWWVLSGTPMVWALGVLRAAVLDTPEVVVAVVHAFQESRTAARQQAPTVLAAAAAQAGIPESAVQAIYDRQTVEIGAAEQGGLAAFYRHTQRLRLT